MAPQMQTQPHTQVAQPRAPLTTALYYGTAIRLIQGAVGLVELSKQLYRRLSWSTSPTAPTLTKTYNCRPSLTVRIFYPQGWDKNSPTALPCYFSVHGGGFCVGFPADDDAWNRAFADEHQILVVELDYRKSPAHPFPTAIHDLEALMLAVYDDDTLPIDKRRIALGGFSAGGNLTSAVCQLDSIRNRIRPSALCPIYPAVDLSVSINVKIKQRYFKPTLGSGQRSRNTDLLFTIAPVFNWSYLPIGVDRTTPLLSPLFAPRDTLPKKIFIVAAELDLLAHEAWRFASKLAHRPEPAIETRVGQENKNTVQGDDGLILDDERFAFQHVDADGNEVRWLLIPDQIHGFDIGPLALHGSQAAFQDAQTKTKAYRKLLGEWLHQSAWSEA